MTTARGLKAASLSLALSSAFFLCCRTDSVRAEVRPAVQTHRVIPGTSRIGTSGDTRFSDLPSRSGVLIRPVDEVNPAPNSPASNGETPRVTHTRTQKMLVRTVVPYQVRFIQSVQIPAGRRLLCQEGSPGVREDHLLVTTVDGRVVQRQLLNYWWDRRPKDRLIAVGVDPFSSSRSLTGMGRVLDMVATEYDVYLGGAGSGRTCTGIRARRGIVAVDPRYIPLGTHLYVEGYGYCVAADTGGAIKGRRIDLCVESPREANDYGVHRVRVLVVR